MGLDNGIIIRHMTPDQLPNCVHPMFAFGEEDTQVSVAYWRKCWGIRNSILWAITSRIDDEFEFVLNKADIGRIIDVIDRFLKREYWDEYADSIWTYDEYRGHNLQIRQNLLWLYEHWDQYPQIEVVFYDSY